MAQGCAWVSGIEFEYTHDLRRLIAEVKAVVGEFPFDNAQVVALTEHAVPLRYDEILDTEPIDRQATLALVHDVGSWAATQLRTPWTSRLDQARFARPRPRIAAVT